MEDRAIQDVEAVDINLHNANVEYNKQKNIYVETQEIFNLEPLDLSLAGSIAKKKLLKTEEGQRFQNEIEHQNLQKLPPLADQNYKRNDDLNVSSKRKISCSILPVVKGTSESSKECAKKYNGDNNGAVSLAGPSGLCNPELSQGECSNSDASGREKISSPREIKSQDGEKSGTFKYEECSYSSDWGNNLLKQIRVHEKQKSFKCSECPMAFWLKSSLINHLIAIHKKLKPFACIECNYSCNLISNLKMHIQGVHEKEKPFKCDECEYRGCRKSTLVKHIRAVHKKEKPFKCSECERAFGSKSNLDCHILSIHRNEKPFKCNECNYSCCFKGTLKKHNQSVHRKRNT